jgi:hypothetical protein
MPDKEHFAALDRPGQRDVPRRWPDIQTTCNATLLQARQPDLVCSSTCLIYIPQPQQDWLRHATIDFHHIGRLAGRMRHCEQLRAKYNHTRRTTRPEHARLDRPNHCSWQQ